MKNLAIIPARGGSKRIPHKNIKPFLGKPIIAYSIEVALNSGLFEEVMVSTDDEEIASVAVKYGASVPFMRFPQTADDYATLAAVLEEVVGMYAKAGIDMENICCILSTAPLISKEDIIGAYQQFENSVFQAICPVVAFSYPILRSLKMSEEGLLEMRWKEYQHTRSQDLELAYHDSGSFYWIKKEALLKHHALFIPECGGIVVDEMKVQDIDTEQDWKLAELKYKLLNHII